MASQSKNHAAVWTTSVEQVQYQKGRHFLVIPRKIDTDLPVLVVALSVFQQLQMFRYKSDAMQNTWNRFHSCLSVAFTIPSAGFNWEQLCFVVCVLKSKMVNSNVPHLYDLRSLVLVSCIEIIVQVKISILSSVRSNKHMMASLSALCERSDYKLVNLNFRSYNGEIV